jgi:hypothetical protein
MKNDTTTLTHSIELSRDDLACARGGLPVNPQGDPGGPTGRPDFLSPDALRIPAGKLPDLGFISSEKKLPGEQTPPIYVFPTA